MKKISHFLIGAGIVLSLALTLGAAQQKSHAATATGVKLYRIYNPNSGEHFYTENLYEAKSLQNAGWNYEGTESMAPTSGTPVYRLYNPNAGYHFYTSNSYEKQSLVSSGWRYEGISFYSGGSVPLYRAYDPNGGQHNYTTSSGEQNALVKAGWRNEGTAFYALAVGNPNDKDLPHIVNVMRPMTGDYWNYPSETVPYPNLSQYSNVHIDVNKAAQRVYIMSGNTVLYTMYCSTANPALGVTPSGHYAVQNVHGQNLVEYGYVVAKTYTGWLGNGTYLFHSVLLNPDGSVNIAQAQQLGRTPQSHGCIRLSFPDAQWIYSNVPVGTPVNVY